MKRPLSAVPSKPDVEMSDSRASSAVNPLPPFAPFFTLAALDAIAASAVWAPSLAGADMLPLAQLAAWHEGEMLFGYLAAVLSGFFLTALPRWTRRPVPAVSVRLILALWLAARLAAASGRFAVAAALPALALAAFATYLVAATKNTRNVKTIALLWLYAASGIFALGPFGEAARLLALRLAIAALLGLLMVIGGRVVPALSIRFDALCGEDSKPPEKGAGEGLIVASAVAGLIFWLAAPDIAGAAAALACAAAGQGFRMSRWAGKYTAASPPLRALFAAYAMIPAGFAMLAAHAAAPEKIPESAGLHLWLVGGLGGMSLAIMASMIRKRNNLAFAANRAGAAVSLFWLAAVGCRVAAAFSGSPGPWLAGAVACWAAAFALFLFDFRAPLLNGIMAQTP